QVAAVRFRMPAVALGLLLSVALPPGTPVREARAQLGGGGAAPPPAESLVHVRAVPLAIQAGTPARAAIELSIASGWHINANPPSPDYMIPTRVALTPAFGIAAQKPAYPEPQKLKLGFDPNPLAVFTGKATIELPLAVAAD